MLSGPADFRRTTFGGYTTFEGAQFLGEADFRVKKVEQGIEVRNAHFERAPDFIGVDMRESARLDNMTITPPLILRTADKPDKQPTSRTSWFRRLSFGFAIDGDEHARYRKLRKMAADAKDIEKEVLFNGYEIASRRFWVDQPLGAGWDRFWLGAIPRCQTMANPFGGRWGGYSGFG